MLLQYVWTMLSNNINMSFQSSGAILGPPGAPGAPVSLISFRPEPNLSFVLWRNTSRMLILYKPQNLGEPDNKYAGEPSGVILTSEAPLQSIMFAESWRLAKAKRHCDSHTGVSYPPQDMQHHWYVKRTCFSCSAQCRAELTQFAYQLPLLPLIRQFVIWSSPRRHSLTCLTGVPSTTMNAKGCDTNKTLQCPRCTMHINHS